MVEFLILLVGLFVGITVTALLNAGKEDELTRVEIDRDYYKAKAKNYLEMLNSRKGTYEKVECPWESKDNCRVCKAEKEVGEE